MDLYFFLVILIITGVTLATNFNPVVAEAFGASSDRLAPWNFGSSVVCLGFPTVTGVRKRLWFNLSRLYSSKITVESKIKLDPYWITGFFDGEGCITIDIQKSKVSKTGWRVQAIFLIGLHEKDRAVLELIQSYFGGIGNITQLGLNGVQLRVSSLKDLIKIIDHFNKYPLLTQKWADFILWQKVIELIINKEHLTIEGLHKIVAIKAAINRGLSDKLKEIFPNVIPMKRPLVVDQVITDPNWVAGFISGEGCFYIGIIKSSSYKLGETPLLIFKITQHSRDEELMKSLISYFGCGSIYKYREFIDLKVSRIKDLIDIIIPFFDKYAIKGAKAKDFTDFWKVAELMKKGDHLTEEGLNEIKRIKAGMNKGRN